MSSLYQALEWREATVAGTVANAHQTLRVGEVGRSGPRATLTVGTHGDEGPWGALAVRHLLEQPAEALRGRLRVILNTNPLAAESDARNAPLDTLDLNRSFPGDPEGSHTERLAALLAPLVADSDVTVDLHGGGSWCVNAFVFRFEGDEELAHAIGAPFVVDMPEKIGTLTRHARHAGARVVAIEMGGRSRDEMRWRERIATGLLRVLTLTGVLEPVERPAPPADAIPVGPSRVLRPGRGGVFVPTLREDAVGTVVAGGTELGRLLDAHTLAPLETFVAPFARTALLLLRPHVGVLEGGAMTYVVAAPR